MNRVKNSLLWMISVISMFFFFSCLEDNGDMIRYSSRRAVVQETPRKSLWVRDDSIPQGYLISSPEFESREDLREGDCCLVEYRIDFAAAQEQGVYPAEIWRCDTVGKIPLVKASVDTLKILDFEQFVTLAFDKSIYMKGRYFMQLHLNDHQSTRRDLFTFTYDPEQAVQPAEKTGHIYQLYLRSYKNEQPDTVKHESLVLQKALVMDQFIEEAGNREKERGADSLHFVINYPRGFNTDSTALLWTATDTFSIGLF